MGARLEELVRAHGRVLDRRGGAVQDGRGGAVPGGCKGQPVTLGHVLVLDLFGKESPNPEGIARLKIMSMIINETLRLYSPTANITRNTKGEVRLGTFTLPANVKVLIPPLALPHDPEIWGQDAHLFKPERFAEGMAKATNNNAAAFSFIRFWTSIFCWLKLCKP
ncbi:hypothetical protein RJ640_008061 [Escallonia rubra]|uniref:Uncharacterized protein n=1 Tax=Escallonia rubra TaxID=112253 RepID=A0AA88R850_9ASTE|nr:hypothetical protein RJ640_008061 [Escallonia rubra]